MTARVLVAGVGNVFLGDDAFGVAVAEALAGTDLPPGVEVVEMGIRAVHLAYQLLDGYDGLVLVDAMDRGEPPGTLVVVAWDLDGADAEEPPELIDAHSLDPDSVLKLLRTLIPRLGGRLGPVRIVGCQPADLSEGMGLSPLVAAAVSPAVSLVRQVATTLVSELDGAGGGAKPAPEEVVGVGVGRAHPSSDRKEGEPCCDV